jgi:hypothetical protein
VPRDIDERPLFGNSIADIEGITRRPDSELERLSRQMYIPFWSFTIVHAGLGEIRLALECLEKVIENRESLLVVIKYWPHFDGLRNESRFQEIERRIGLRTKSDSRTASHHAQAGAKTT